MADQETIPIGLETQNKVAEAIYLRWYSNGARHPRPWNEMPMEGKEPWRRVGAFHASACGQVRRLAVLRRRRRIHGMRRHPDRHEASGLHRLLDERQAGRPVLRLEPCERRGQGAGKMSYNVVTTEGIRTFENIDDAGDYAQAMSLRTGEPAKVFHAETGLVAFTVRPTTKDTK